MGRRADPLASLSMGVQPVILFQCLIVFALSFAAQVFFAKDVEGKWPRAFNILLEPRRGTWSDAIATKCDLAYCPMASPAIPRRPGLMGTVRAARLGRDVPSWAASFDGAVHHGAESADARIIYTASARTEYGFFGTTTAQVMDTGAPLIRVSDARCLSWEIALLRVTVELCFDEIFPLLDAMTKKADSRNRQRAR